MIQLLYRCKASFMGSACIISDNIVDYSLQEAYSSMKIMDKLKEIEPMIEWESLRPIVKDLYRNHTDKGVRPNIDETVTCWVLIPYSFVSE